jgi:D-threo-aldose 1-dehydrogenase
VLTPSDPTWMRPLGATGLTVSAVCAGGASLGAQSSALVQEILAGPIRTFDTSNNYTDGESERAIGAGIAAFGGLPDDALVATKVDALDGDYSGARVRASLAESRQRLGLDFLPLVYLHDPEYYRWDAMTARGGAVHTLVARKEAGEIGNLGLAGGQVQVMDKYLDLGVFDVLLVHNRWTLVDRSAGELLQRARERGLGVVNAAVYGGGILARQTATRTGSTGTGSADLNYGYRPAHPDTLRAVSSMRSLCDRYGTDLATAALQFSVRDDGFATTIVGFSRSERLGQVQRSLAVPLPEEFWKELEQLVPAKHAWLDHQDRS